ncbi:hypothetical protein FRC07_004133 [Ceratobasidium sp. 392]|nr:hypothetical protein FRC07_004133 [Ceratobasidium sp. 392]
MRRSQNEPTTPKTRPKRAVAPRKLVDPLPSPPPKRARPLQERNDSNDFEMKDAESDIEILSSPVKPTAKSGKGKAVSRPKKANKEPRVIPHSTFQQYWREAIDKTAYMSALPVPQLPATMTKTTRTAGKTNPLVDVAERVPGKENAASHAPASQPSDQDWIMAEETFHDVLAMAKDDIEGSKIAAEIANEAEEDDG